MRTSLTTLFTLGCCAAFTAVASGEIIYSATLESMEKLRVEMTVPVKGPITKFQIPNFAPGHYVVLTVAGDVSETQATGPDGAAIQVEKVDANTYQVATPFRGFIKFSYAKPMRAREGAILWQGPYEYMYVLVRKDEACQLNLQGPEGCRFHVSLDPNGKRLNSYKAPNYDVLADCPVSAGDLLVDVYTVQNKPHYLVMSGAAKSEIDVEYLKSVCKAITETESAIFGGLPYKRYMWHLRINDSEAGGGGLEHLNSTNIGLAAGMSKNAMSVLPHEFFHLWNVKRIRSAPLGPFDYLSIPKTGALWWLEGVTDYYADVVFARAGITTEKDFMDSIVSNVVSVRSNRRRFDTSPYDASYRVGEAAGGRGNSQGFNVNYYNTGWVAGLCFDAEIRSRTLGKYSLDDVMRALYAICKDNKPGFAEDEIRRQLVRFGGAEMGPIYDEWIMKPGELPVEACLAKIGYSFSPKVVSEADFGFAASPAKALRGMRVRAVSPRDDQRLKVDDVIVEVNGVSCESTTLYGIASAYRKGFGEPEATSALNLRVRRGDERFDVHIDSKPRSIERLVAERQSPKDARFMAALRGWITR